MNSITILIDGKTMTGNMACRSFRGRQYKPREFHAWTSYVYSHALEQALKQGWKMPDYCVSYVSLYNSNCDRDNGVKVLNDALQGVLYQYDSRILDGPIRIVKDFGEPRIEITILEIPDSLYWMYRQKRKKDPPPLTHERWVSAHIRSLYGSEV